MPEPAKIFLSFASPDRFEALLLKIVLRRVYLRAHRPSIWIYTHDQAPTTPNVPVSLKREVKSSDAFILLLSRSTLNRGSNQWMELAYADAYKKPTFVLLHRINYDVVKKHRNTPVFLQPKHCTHSRDWKSMVPKLDQILRGRP